MNDINSISAKGVKF
jgi:predicted outer membrane repeat protein